MWVRVTPSLIDLDWFGSEKFDLFNNIFVSSNVERDTQLLPGLIQ